MTPVKAEFIAGPLDGRIFWSRGDEIFEMPTREWSDRTMVYRRDKKLASGRIAYRWDGYREDGIAEVKLI